MARFSELDFIIRYEAGELSDSETLKLFSHLVKTGRAWDLQGHYGRTTEALIEGGYLSQRGRILRKI